MTKLTLALALIASVAFATAYTNVAVTDDTSDNLTIKAIVKCTERVHGRNFNMCHSYIAAAQRSRQGIQTLSGLRKECCNLIKEFKPECRCGALQEVYLQSQNHDDVMEKVLPIIQKLPDQCKFDVKPCPIPAAKA